MLTRFPFGSEETKRRTKEASVISKNGRKKFAQRENFKKEGRGRGQVSWKSVRKTGRGFNTPALVSVAREGR